MNIIHNKWIDVNIERLFIAHKRNIKKFHFEDGCAILLSYCNLSNVFIRYKEIAKICRSVRTSNWYMDFPTKMCQYCYKGAISYLVKWTQRLHYSAASLMWWPNVLLTIHSFYYACCLLWYMCEAILLVVSQRLRKFKNISSCTDRTHLTETKAGFWSFVLQKCSPKFQKFDLRHCILL